MHLESGTGGGWQVTQPPVVTHVDFCWPKCICIYIYVNINIRCGHGVAPLPVANKGLGTGTPNAKNVMSSWWPLESWEGAISNIYIHTDSPLYFSIYLYRMYIRNDTHSTMCD